MSQEIPVVDASEQNAQAQRELEHIFRESAKAHGGEVTDEDVAIIARDILESIRNGEKE